MDQTISEVFGSALPTHQFSVVDRSVVGLRSSMSQLEQMMSSGTDQVDGR